MSVIVNEVRKGFYLDSVALMRLSAEISALAGIDDAVLMIGSPSNRQIMADAGLLNPDGEQAGPNDLVIALRADSDGNANRAIAHARKSLQGGSLKSSAEAALPRTLSSAQTQLPDANLALISTPGSHAAREARAALQRGLNVMIFSDNVSIADELSLKQQADNNGLIVMGPDCGTAIIGGVALAFANVVARGNTGVVAASGTGLQEFSVLLAKLGGGIQHAIGVGGRDLSDDIGAISTLKAIDLLAADPAVETLVLISKPPGKATADRVFEKLANTGKPVIACVFGLSQAELPNGIRHAGTIKAAAEMAGNATLNAADKATPQALADSLSAERTVISGLYTGGTLCTEAQRVLRSAGINVASNAPAPGADAQSPHQLIDLGADEYTMGKPHPMIEPSVREPALQQALTNPQTAVILIDVVLGYGAHPDPAQSVINTLAAGNPDRPLVIASVCGTDADPQDLATQSRKLRDAGVIVCACNADAAALTAQIVTHQST